MLRIPKRDKIVGDKHYIGRGYEYPPFEESHDERETLKVIYYLILLLLEDLSNGIFYKFRISPKYSFKIIEQEEETEVTVLDRTLKTKYHPVVGYYVTHYSPKVKQLSDYYYNTEVRPNMNSCKQVIFNNIIRLLKKIDVKLAKVCSTITNLYQLLNVLDFYTNDNYSIEYEIDKTERYFMSIERDEEFGDVKDFESLIEHYKKYNKEQLFYLLVRWHYNIDEEMDEEFFDKYTTKLFEGKISFKDFIMFRRDINNIKKFFE